MTSKTRLKTCSPWAQIPRPCTATMRTQPLRPRRGTSPTLSRMLRTYIWKKRARISTPSQTQMSTDCAIHSAAWRWTPISLQKPWTDGKKTTRWCTSWNKRDSFTTRPRPWENSARRCWSSSERKTAKKQSPLFKQPRLKRKPRSHSLSPSL